MLLLPVGEMGRVPVVSSICGMICCLGVSIDIDMCPVVVKFCICLVFY